MQKTKEVILNISSIDGAIMMDENCISYGVGLIVDGEAIVKGDVSRGARYNSIYNYIHIKKREDKRYLAIVVSEDGMVDVLHTI